MCTNNKLTSHTCTLGALYSDRKSPIKLDRSVCGRRRKERRESEERRERKDRERKGRGGERIEKIDKTHCNKKNHRQLQLRAHVDGRSKWTRTPENYVYTQVVIHGCIPIMKQLERRFLGRAVQNPLARFWSC